MRQFFVGKNQIRETIKTKKRVNRTLKIVATTPKVLGDEPVAQMELTLSLKVKN